MPPIKGVEMLVERSLLLGRLHHLGEHRLQSLDDRHSYQLKAAVLQTSPNVFLICVILLVFSLRCQNLYSLALTLQQ